MKILFIYPGNAPSYPIQLGSLSAYVQRGGHATRLFAPALRDWRVPGWVLTEMDREIAVFRPDFIGFCGYESAMSWIRQFALAVKIRHPHIRTILGGYYPSACPEEAIHTEGIDYVIRGEGEAALHGILDGPDRKNIPGVWPNPPGPIVSDLDSLPWPDRFNNQQEIIDADSGTIKVMAGWGCVYNCTYCQAKEMRKLAPSTKAKDYVRLRSVDNVIAELVDLAKRYKFLRVGFHDDIFWSGQMDWLREFADKYRQQIHLPFYCAARVEMFTDEVFDLLHWAGCYLILIGVESGDGAFRRKILRRNMGDEKIRWVVTEARRRGIQVWTFNMVGMLDESYRSMLATIKLNWSLSPDFAMCSVWYPLRGTAMGDEAHKRGMVNERAAERVTSYANRTVLRYSWTKKVFLVLARWANILSANRRSLFWRLVVERGKISRRAFSKETKWDSRSETSKALV